MDTSGSFTTYKSVQCTTTLFGCTVRNSLSHEVVDEGSDVVQLLSGTLTLLSVLLPVGRRPLRQEVQGSVLPM